MAEPCQTNRNETRYLQCPGDDWNLAIIVLPHVTIAMIHVTFRKKIQMEIDMSPRVTFMPAKSFHLRNCTFGNQTQLKTI